MPDGVLRIPAREGSGPELRLSEERFLPFDPETVIRSRAWELSVRVLALLAADGGLSPPSGRECSEVPAPGWNFSWGLPGRDG